MMVAFFASASARAAEPDVDRFKAEIDAFLGRLGPSSNGAVEWVGSDPYEIRRDGEALLATIENARLSLNTPQPGQLVLDRVEIREIARKEEGKLIELALTLPTNMILRETDGIETKITLTAARANAVVESESGRGRETYVEIASARIDQPKTGTWVSLGPLSMSSKLVAEPNGGWSGPVEFEVKGIEYFLPQGPVGGAIDRIAFAGKSAGPRLRAGFMLAPDNEFAINPATRITNPTVKPLSARLNRLSVAEDIFTSIRKKVRTISIVNAGRIPALGIVAPKCTSEAFFGSRMKSRPIAKTAPTN